MSSTIRLTREIIEKIDCKKELSFQTIENANPKELFRQVCDNLYCSEDSNKITLLSNGKFVIEGKDGLGLFMATDFSAIDFHNVDTSNATIMADMFHDCYDLIKLDLSTFNTSNVEDMSNMFMWCCKLDELDLSSFDTYKVTDMSSMFCNANIKKLSISSFNTSNVEDMSWMFEGINQDRLDLSDTDKLDLLHFNTSKVKSMYQMFMNCNMKSLNLSSFVVKKGTDKEEMFLACLATLEETEKTDKNILRQYRYDIGQKFNKKMIWDRYFYEDY